MTRWLVLLVALLALTAIPTPAQTPAGSYFNSFSEPLPNCTPGGVGVRMPVAWDITAQKFMYCSATNTWTQWPSSGGGGGTGTVTSVSLTVPSELSVAGSPCTVACSLVVTKGTETAHTFAAGPLSGPPATWAFRTIDATDLPTVPISSGGTGTASNPVKRMILPYALCSAGSSAASAWDTPAANSAVAACKVGGVNNTVQGVLQFADAQLAYYSGVVPPDWQSWGVARISLTTGDTTNGHTIIFQLAVACEAPNAGNTDDPAYGSPNSFTTVTIGGGAVANASYQTSTAAITGGGCAANSIAHWKLLRATDTASDTAVAATGWLEVDYNGTYQ